MALCRAEQWLRRVCLDAGPLSVLVKPNSPLLSTQYRLTHDLGPMRWGSRQSQKHSAWIFFSDTLQGLNMPEPSSLWAFALVEPHAGSTPPYGSCEAERSVSVSGNQAFAQTGPCWNCSSLSSTLKFLKATLRLSPPQAFAWACSLLLLHPCSLSSPEGLVYWPTPEKRNSYFPIQPKPQLPQAKYSLRCPLVSSTGGKANSRPHTDKTSICRPTHSAQSTLPFWVPPLMRF